MTVKALYHGFLAVTVIVAPAPNKFVTMPLDLNDSSSITNLLLYTLALPSIDLGTQ